MELFDYIEVFYNQRLWHSTLGQISSAVFEPSSESSGNVDSPESVLSSQPQPESDLT